MVCECWQLWLTKAEHYRNYKGYVLGEKQNLVVVQMAGSEPDELKHRDQQCCGRTVALGTHDEATTSLVF